jgi:hypothetical protein
LSAPPLVFPVAITGSPDAVAVLDILQKWDLTDVLDLHLQADAIEVIFRTTVSAHVCCRLLDFKAAPLCRIPKGARVPLVYVQGISPDTKVEEIHNFFKSIAPIVKMTFVVRETISAHLLKFSSTRKALRVSETADRERFNGNLQSNNNKLFFPVGTDTWRTHCGVRPRGGRPDWSG